MKVHPRIRGEDSDWFSSPPSFAGSPPHTRGRLCSIDSYIGHLGFTPAYAGKIEKGRPGGRRNGVHPRIRGEDYAPEHGIYTPVGSPPHTRGRLKQHQPGMVPGRFTPAYAGKIMGHTRHPALLGVHPRIRGEDPSCSPFYTRHSGSPPHTRGRLKSGIHDVIPGRFTPAYAGKIQSLRCQTISCQVHPRIRGEDGGAGAYPRPF